MIVLLAAIVRTTDLTLSGTPRTAEWKEAKFIGRMALALGVRFNIQAFQIGPTTKLYRNDAIRLSVLNNLEGSR